MGNAFGCLTLSDLEKATSSDVGLFVGKIGPDYKKWESPIIIFHVWYTIDKEENDSTLIK